MRADRLLSMLMLLQTRGRLTARELAAELEISERTVYRDVDALSAAGVPVYGEAGPDGGYALLESYRTTLTGLTDHEVRALFMLTIPEPLADLGVSGELKSALLKLTAALPAARQPDRERVRQRIYLDSTEWDHVEEAAPHMPLLYQAIWQDRQLTVRFAAVTGPSAEYVIHPYGLVAKAGVWQLVYAHHARVRACRVTQIVEAQLTDRQFERPAKFDLAAFWQNWCREYRHRRGQFSAIVRVTAAIWPEVARLLGPAAQVEPTTEADQVIAKLFFDSFDSARARLLSLGRAVEVLEPWPLRRSVLDYAEQIVALYAQGERAN